MSIPASFETLIEYIEALSPEDQVIATAEIVPVQIRSTQSDNPWIGLAGKYKDDLLFDEFLADIEVYRRELDAETDADYSWFRLAGKLKDNPLFDATDTGNLLFGR